MTELKQKPEKSSPSPLRLSYRKPAAEGGKYF